MASSLRWRFGTLALIVIASSCGPLPTRSGGQAKRKVVPITSLDVQSISLVFSRLKVCPGDHFVLGALVKTPEREFAAVGRDDRSEQFAPLYRERITAALQPGDHVKTEDLEVTVEGPARNQGARDLYVSADVAEALRGPIRVTARVRGRPDGPVAHASVPITFACNYKFSVSGAKGEPGREGQAGEPGYGSMGRGGPGQAGGDAGDGGDGGTIEISAAPLRAAGRELLQVVAIDVAARTRRQFLIAPGGTLTASATGGRGGAGGRGGRGGRGFDQQTEVDSAGDGGTGGPGGRGGVGGRGGQIRIVAEPSIEPAIEKIIKSDVLGGVGGDGGAGGYGGDGGTVLGFVGSRDSVAGQDGAGGQGGPGGTDGSTSIEPRKLGSLFAVSEADVIATLKALEQAPEADAPGDAVARTNGDAAERSPGKPGANASARPNSPSPAITKPGPATSKPSAFDPNAERRRVATGTFATAPLEIVDRKRKVIARLRRDGVVEIGGREHGKFEGGTFMSNGAITMALDRKGTLHLETRGGLSPFGALEKGRLRALDGAREIAVAADGAITITTRGRARVLASRFTAVPAAGRQIALVLVLIASARLQ